MSLLEKSIQLAKKMHRGQVRKTGEDYIHHCLRVMNTISQHTQDEEILSACVLHDICEDTKITLPNLSKEFSPKISFMVNSLSKNQKLENHDPIYRVRMYLNRFTKGCLTDHWILFIKMADQIDNSSSFDIFSSQKVNRKTEELTELFLPLYAKISKDFSKKEKIVYEALLSQLQNNISQYTKKKSSSKI